MKLITQLYVQGNAHNEKGTYHLFMYIKSYLPSQMHLSYKSFIVLRT